MTEAPAEEVRRQRAGSFGGVAGEYERSRPGYPDAAVRWMTSENPRVVLDLAAGTGKLTRQLHALAHQVVAVEPSVEMLHHLRTVEPSIAAVAGHAEAIPYGDACFDLVTVAQAWHWFDQPAAMSELARVLRPGGHACILWNFRDESHDWVRELSKLIGSEGTNDQETDPDPLAESDEFASSVIRTFSFEQPLDPDLLVSLVRSRSYVATLPEEERRTLLDGIVRLCREHPALARRERFTMPYRTKVFRAERIAARVTRL